LRARRIGELSDGELAQELIVAAMAPDRRRFTRFRELLAEQSKRRRQQSDLRIEFLEIDWTPTNDGSQL
jgi:hypothetical protein